MVSGRHDRQRSKFVAASAHPADMAGKRDRKRPRIIVKIQLYRMFFTVNNLNVDILDLGGIRQASFGIPAQFRLAVTIGFEVKLCRGKGLLRGKRD